MVGQALTCRRSKQAGQSGGYAWHTSSKQRRRQQLRAGARRSVQALAGSPDRPSTLASSTSCSPRPVAVVAATSACTADTTLLWRLPPSRAQAAAATPNSARVPVERCSPSQQPGAACWSAKPNWCSCSRCRRLAAACSSRALSLSSSHSDAAGTPSSWSAAARLQARLQSVDSVGVSLRTRRGALSSAGNSDSSVVGRWPSDARPLRATGARQVADQTLALACNEDVPLLSETFPNAPHHGSIERHVHTVAGAIAAVVSAASRCSRGQLSLHQLCRLHFK